MRSPDVEDLLAPTEPKPIFLGAAAAGLGAPPPTCPNPSRPTAMPNRSTSPLLRSFPCDLPGLSGVGLAILVESETAATVLGFVSAAAASSASGS